jgi:hypothetical protein
MFEFYNTVTVAIEVLSKLIAMIITFNPDSLGGNGTTMGFNMHGHATFVGIGRETFQVTHTLFTGT